MSKTAHFSTDYGTGNQVSAEFNLAYRWHSAISEKDDQWTQNLYKELFGKEAEDVSLPELLQGLGKWEHGLDKDPQKRPFAHLKRDANGRLPDQGLVDLLVSSIEDTAGAFGANNIPKCLKAITVLGVGLSGAHSSLFRSPLSHYSRNMSRNIMITRERTC